MKLYIVSDDIDVRNRWANAFAELNPVAYSKLPSPMGEASILMILDRVISNTDDAALQKLFQHRIMVLSMIPNFSEAQRFLQLGAMGYGNAMMHPSHLHSVYQALEEGKIWLHPDFITQLISQVHEVNIHKEVALHRLDVLTPRERQVALLLNEGKRHLDISEKLGITIRTVKAHSAAIYEKLAVKDRLALSLLLHS